MYVESSWNEELLPIRTSYPELSIIILFPLEAESFDAYNPFVDYLSYYIPVVFLLTLSFE